LVIGEWESPKGTRCGWRWTMDDRRWTIAPKGSLRRKKGTNKSSIVPAFSSRASSLLAQLVVAGTLHGLVFIKQTIPPGKTPGPLAGRTPPGHGRLLRRLILTTHPTGIPLRVRCALQCRRYGALRLDVLVRAWHAWCVGGSFDDSSHGEASRCRRSNRWRLVAASVRGGGERRREVKLAGGAR